MVKLMPIQVMQRGRKFILSIALLIAVFTVPLSAQSDGVTRIAIVDGNSLAYENNRPKSNHEVWAQLLPQLLQEQTVEVQYFDIGLPNRENTWVQPSDIVSFKPNLVIMHWSTFGVAKGVQFCRPFGRPKSEHCSQRLLQFMDAVFVGSPNVRFLAYSRAGNLCRSGYLRNLGSQIGKTFVQDRFSDRLGVILFTKASGRGPGFSSERSQRDINSIVRHLSGLQDYNFLPTDARDGLCMYEGMEEEG